MYCKIFLLLLLNPVYSLYFQNRIVKAEKCKLDQYPYMVSIQKRFMDSNDPEDPERWPLCAGTLLNAKWVLSASHCFMDSEGALESLNEYIVVFGLYNLSKPLFWKDWRLIAAVVINRDRWNEPKIMDDIALVRTTSGVAYSESIQPVSLPFSIDTIESLIDKNISCHAVGWIIDPNIALGASESLVNDSLLCAKENVANYTFCSNELQKRPLNVTFSKGKFCTFNLSNNNNSCETDSGGPLICDGIQYGIMSRGLGCDSNNFLRIYTDVGRYLNWIIVTVGKINLVEHH